MSRNRVFWKGLPLRYPLPILLRSLSPKIANANNQGKDRPWLHRENERNEEGDSLAKRARNNECLNSCQDLARGSVVVVVVIVVGESEEETR